MGIISNSYSALMYELLRDKKKFYWLAVSPVSVVYFFLSQGVEGATSHPSQPPPISAPGEGPASAADRRLTNCSKPRFTANNTGNLWAASEAQPE